jgi:hypothetical protein
MALRFKKDFENQTIALPDGTLIDRNTIGSAYAQERLKAMPSLSYMLESDTTTNPPVTGGGGAGDPRPPKKTTTARAKK